VPPITTIFVHVGFIGLFVIIMDSSNMCSIVCNNKNMCKNVYMCFFVSLFLCFFNKEKNK
jgi:hypothetical protein